MATLREIKRRVVSVKNTQKITKAMKMVAAAKLRRAQEMLIATRPYADRMNSMLRHLASRTDHSLNPLLLEREMKRGLLVVVAGDRGMCGAFNGNIVKAASEYIKNSFREDPGKIAMVTIGKKASDFFSKQDCPLVAKHPGVFRDLNFETAKRIVKQIVDGYISADYDRVEIIYNEFKNVMQQKIVIEQFLPIPPEQILTKGDSQTAINLDYIYEPSDVEVLNLLLPKQLDFQMWHILLESSTAEEGARMTAMNNATDNAGTLIDDLTLSYNKARQASITKELLEIVSGAEALKKAG
jgi:F-type H+-transporting ATPase subunit gamma